MAEKRETVKILTLNIEYAASITRGYWQYFTSVWKYVIPHNVNAVKRVARVINNENVDICTFVEIDGGSFRTFHGNYMKRLANMTVLKKYNFFPVRKILNLVNQGNGILTKFDILETKNFQLARHGEHRALSLSKLKIDGKTITMLTTQLALGRFSRRKELEQIAEIIKTIKEPIIFTGDLNTSNEYELEVINKTGLIRLETPKTFPSWKPRRRIDYIYYSPDFEVLNYYVIDDLKVSDHLPIIAEFRLK